MDRILRSTSAPTVHHSDIDGLRAVAILPVVLFHLDPRLLLGGFVGVDIFFVISGFLITGILHREITLGRFALVGFYGRRVRRIFPALFSMLLLVSGGAFSGEESVLASLLEGTVGFLKSSGVENIILVGDSPRYYLDVEQISLWSAAAYASPRSGSEHEAVFERLARHLSIHFVSPMGVLCASGRCRIRNDARQIFQWGDGHYTHAGSHFVVERLLAPFFLQ